MPIQRHRRGRSILWTNCARTIAEPHLLSTSHRLITRGTQMGNTRASRPAASVLISAVGAAHASNHDCSTAVDDWGTAMMTSLTGGDGTFFPQRDPARDQFRCQIRWMLGWFIASLTRETCILGACMHAVERSTRLARCERDVAGFVTEDVASRPTRRASWQKSASRFIRLIVLVVASMRSDCRQ